LAATPPPDCTAVAGWTQRGPVRAYVADTLFEYMNGNSEGYLTYSFQKMQGVTCLKGGDEIVFDISEMENPEFAWGIFVSNRNPNFPVLKIGIAGQVQDRRAIFSKGKYFVEMAANPAKDHSPVLKQFVDVWEKKVEGGTTLPGILGWFPEEGLDKDSMRLVPESVLGFRMLRRGYLALYAKGKAFIVPEASVESTSGLLAKLKDRVGNTAPAQVGDEAWQANDKYLGRICVFRKGRYLAGFANLPADTDPVPLAQKLAARIQ
jgi:hypothetical protein